MPYEDHTTEAGPIIEAVERLTRKSAHDAKYERTTLPDGTLRLTWRDANGQLQTDDHAPDDRARGTIETLTVPGFAEALRHQRGQSGVDPLVRFGGDRITATINPACHNCNDRGDHHIVLMPDLSSEWMRWRAFCNQDQPRRRAAEFIEDNEDDFAGGLTPHGSLLEWAQRLTLKALREIEQSDTEDGDRTTLEGSATLTHVTRLALRVFDGGPVIGFRCRWRAGLDTDGRLCIRASIVNADEAIRRLWLGPIPDGAEWSPIVEEVAEAIGQPVIV